MLFRHKSVIDNIQVEKVKNISEKRNEYFMKIIAVKFLVNCYSSV
jgi:hypothetical protein